MISVSLCMIVRDEEDVLARCLESVGDVADEIIIVDTGSRDSTRSIAERYTSHIFDFPWIDDFSAARNFSFSKASKDYCMWLDADDLLLPVDRERFLELKQTLPPDTDIVFCPYHTAFDRDGIPVFSCYRERLIRRTAGFCWQGAVHEAITPSGNIYRCEAAVTHRKIKPGDPGRNLRIYEKLFSEGRPVSARDRFYYARELMDLRRFDAAVQAFERFLEDPCGWSENKIEACLNLSKCQKALGQTEQALQSLFRAFLYDRPRPETCCAIGQHFIEQQAWENAAWWFYAALKTAKNTQPGDGFIQTDCYGWLPYIQLCVCSWHLGDWRRAARYNRLAGHIKPHDPYYLGNRAFFENLEASGHSSPAGIPLEDAKTPGL